MWFSYSGYVRVPLVSTQQCLLRGYLLILKMWRAPCLTLNLSHYPCLVSQSSAESSERCDLFWRLVQRGWEQTEISFTPSGRRPLWISLSWISVHHAETNLSDTALTAVFSELHFPEKSLEEAGPSRMLFFIMNKFNTINTEYFVCYRDAEPQVVLCFFLQVKVLWVTFIQRLWNTVVVDFSSCPHVSEALEGQLWFFGVGLFGVLVYGQYITYIWKVT